MGEEFSKFITCLYHIFFRFSSADHACQIVSVVLFGKDCFNCCLYSSIQRSRNRIWSKIFCWNCWNRHIVVFEVWITTKAYFEYVYIYINIHLPQFVSAQIPGGFRTPTNPGVSLATRSPLLKGGIQFNPILSLWKKQHPMKLLRFISFIYVFFSTRTDAMRSDQHSKAGPWNGGSVLCGDQTG